MSNRAEGDLTHSTDPASELDQRDLTDISNATLPPLPPDAAAAPTTSPAVSDQSTVAAPVESHDSSFAASGPSSSSSASSSAADDAAAAAKKTQQEIMNIIASLSADHSRGCDLGAHATQEEMERVFESASDEETWLQKLVVDEHSTGRRQYLSPQQQTRHNEIVGEEKKQEKRKKWWSSHCILLIVGLIFIVLSNPITNMISVYS